MASKKKMKTPAKKTAVKKPAAKKVVAKKVVAKKAAAKKVAAKKAAPKKVVMKKASAKKSTASKKSMPTKTVNPAQKNKTNKSDKISTQVKSASLVATKKAVSTVVPPKNVDYSKAITPLGDRLVIKLESRERVTAGGLIIPETVSQATGFLRAKVLAVGHGAFSKKGHLKPMDVKKGDTILFSQHAGMKIQFNSEDLQIIKETDVMGVVPN